MNVVDDTSQKLSGNASTSGKIVSVSIYSKSMLTQYIFV
jgi:hypothetical protein